MDSKAVKIGAAVLLPHIGGIVGGRITAKSLTGWYEGLIFPKWRPPNYIFGPVWTTLYSGMGYASYLVWRDGGGFSGDAKTPLMLYGSQLALNWAWTPLFFGCHKISWAAAEICALTATAAACGVSFYRINPLAGLIFIPYVAWLSFASLLNYRLYRDNPEAIEEETKSKKKKSS